MELNERESPKSFMRIEFDAKTCSDKVMNYSSTAEFSVAQLQKRRFKHRHFDHFPYPFRVGPYILARLIPALLASRYQYR